MTDAKKYRSAAWFSKLDKDGFIHRSWVGRGLPPDVFDGRPIVGICNTWSELTPCNATFPRARRARQARRLGSRRAAVRVSGDVHGETSLRPTAMLFRNLVSMDVEESIRGNPIDGVVLLCGCDKTTPSLDHGRGELRRAGDRRLGRRDAQRQLSRQADRIGHRRLAVQRGSARRPDDAAGVLRGRILHVAIERRVHGDGHRLHDGQRRRSARPRLAAERRDPGRGLAALRARASGRPPDRRAHQGGCADLADPHARSVRERDPRERRRRRLDERRHSSAGDRRARRRAAVARRLGHARPGRADAREPHAVRQVSDGGFLLRGRRAGGHAIARRARAAPRRRAHGERPDCLGKLPRGAELE